MLSREVVGASRIGEVVLGIERMKRISKTFKSKNVRTRQFLDVVTREEAVCGLLSQKWEERSFGC